MCGLAGIAGDTPAGDRSKMLDRMAECQRHRGPDQAGSFEDRAIGLAHRRLSIVDPSCAGRQPMRSPSGRYVLVYNGEVYNFRDLRVVLENRGYSFQSATDSEVVLHAWTEWGPNALDRLEGMYAFAVWDCQEACLHLVRDRLGIKPLYWHHDETGTFVFASEIRALLASGLVQRAVDCTALPAFLSQQTVPTPRTLVRGVRMLPSGCRLEVHLERDKACRPRIHRYWDLLAEADRRRQDLHAVGHDALVQGLRDRLESAVEHHLVADVPLGAFLSGGVDSTAVVSLMGRPSESPVRTFTVAFDQKGYDDGPYARLAAQVLKTDHTEVHLCDDELVGAVPAAVAAQDHPSGDGINTWIVARAAREAGLTVVLSGLGGDELFGGYSSFRRMVTLQKLWPVLSPLPAWARNATSRILRTLRPGVASDKIATLLDTDGTVPSAYPTLREVFGPDQVSGLLAVEKGDGSIPERPYSKHLRRNFAEHPSTPLLAQVSYAEMTGYMRDVLLRDTDQMGMAHSLEIRVPFLDREVVEYTLALPEEARAPSSPPKRFLVEAVEELLPRFVANRPKSGFSMPFERWMRGPLQHFCEEGLRRVACHPAFCGERVRDVWGRFLLGDPRLPWSRPWLLVALGHWLERQQIDRLT